MENFYCVTRRADERRAEFEAEAQNYRITRQLSRATRQERSASWRVLISLPLKDFILVRTISRSVSPAKREIAKSDDAVASAG